MKKRAKNQDIKEAHLRVLEPSSIVCQRFVDALFPKIVRCDCASDG